MQILFETVKCGKSFNVIPWFYVRSWSLQLRKKILVLVCEYSAHILKPFSTCFIWLSISMFCCHSLRSLMWDKALMYTAEFSSSRVVQGLGLFSFDSFYTILDWYCIKVILQNVLTHFVARRQMHVKNLARFVPFCDGFSSGVF